MQKQGWDKNAVNNESNPTNIRRRLLNLPDMAGMLMSSNMYSTDRELGKVMLSIRGSQVHN